MTLMMKESLMEIIYIHIVEIMKWETECPKIKIWITYQ